MNQVLPDPEDPQSAMWGRFSGAARAAQKRVAPESDAAPYGFATRLAARWAQLRRNERFALFQRWSIRAAFASIALLAIVLVVAGGATASPEPPAPIEVPDLNLSLP